MLVLLYVLAGLLGSGSSFLVSPGIQVGRYDDFLSLLTLAFKDNESSHVVQLDFVEF